MSSPEFIIFAAAFHLLAITFPNDACSVCSESLKTSMDKFYHWLRHLSPDCPEYSMFMKCKHTDGKEYTFNDDSGIHRHRVRQHNHVPRPQAKKTSKRARHSDNADEDVGNQKGLGSTSALPKPPNKKARKTKPTRSQRNVRSAQLPSTSRCSPPVDPPAFGSHSRMTSSSTAPLATPPPPPISTFAPPHFIAPGQTALDGSGYSALGQQAYDGYGQPSLGGFGQPAFDGFGQAALDAYGQPPVDEFDLAAFNGFISCAHDMPNWDDPALWTNALPGDEAGFDFGAFMTGMDAPAMDMVAPTMDVAAPAMDFAAPTMDFTAPAMDLSRHPNTDFPPPAQLAEPANEPARAPSRAMPPSSRASPPSPRAVPLSPRVMPPQPAAPSHSRGSHGARSSRGVNPGPPREGNPRPPRSEHPQPSRSMNSRRPRTLTSAASRTFHPYARPSTRRRPPSNNPIKFAGLTFTNFDGTSPNPAFAAGPSASRVRTERYPPVPPPSVDGCPVMGYQAAPMTDYQAAATMTSYQSAPTTSYQAAPTTSYQAAPTMDFYAAPAMHPQQQQRQTFVYQQRADQHGGAEWMSNALTQSYQQQQQQILPQQQVFEPQQQVFEPQQQVFEPQQQGFASQAYSFPLDQQLLDPYATEAFDFDPNAIGFTDNFWPDLGGAPMPDF
uniref:C2H2-type domain-containing protein n=1 Tax=Schizophyllum commune (strain H4-8 / FGSC 9210) TaxID=578458 RepID=D8Q6L5_SCHCM